MELTKQWVLVTTGPANFISFEPGKRGRTTALQVAISPTMPIDGAEGHEITGLMNAVLDAGENLYARSNGNVGSIVVTDAPPASSRGAQPSTGNNQQKLKVVNEIQKNQAKSNNKAGEKNG